jgi:ribosome-associated heat shock protein Hsp15
VDPSTDPVRIDKWLWAARLLKTRSLATDAVTGGRVQVGGQRVKPSKDVKPGDRVDVNYGQGRRVEVIVRGTAERRGPASQAQLLYDETPGSAAAREQHVAERRSAMPPVPITGAGRPTKRDRRRLDAMRRGQRGGR